MNGFGSMGLIVLAGFLVGIPTGYAYGFWWGVAGYVVGQLIVLAGLFRYTGKQKRSQ